MVPAAQQLAPWVVMAPWLERKELANPFSRSLFLPHPPAPHLGHCHMGSETHSDAKNGSEPQLLDPNQLSLCALSTPSATRWQCCLFLS